VTYGTAAPTPAQLARSRPVLEGRVDAVHATLKERYDVSEITFFGSIMTRCAPAPISSGC
jgi:hypothetical protein